MEKWVGKIAVVTGASAGIGASIAKELANIGIIVIGLARRVNRVEELNQSIKGTIHAYQCDVSKEDSIISTFKWIGEKFGTIDILINNAGIARLTTLLDPNNSTQIHDLVNVNLMAVLFCTREAFKYMGEEGHIININSTLGHKTPVMNGLNIYPGTKYAITASSEVLRQELIHLKREKIRVTSLSPGITKTEIMKAAGGESEESFADTMPSLNPEDVAHGVLYILSTPSHVQVYELTLKPVGETMC